jgi:uncharacterized LabA/DUF88 family protein
MAISAHNRQFGRVGIFIDGNNLFHAARSLGIEIDYAKLLGVFCSTGTLMRAFFYTGVDENASKQQGFLLWMKRNGYKVIQKELKVFSDGTKRANLDIEMTVDMLSLARSVDTIMLVSGDEDFAYAMRYLSEQGKQIVLSGFRVNISPSLMDVADYFLDLEQHIDDIVKENHHNFTSQTDMYMQQNQVKPSTLASRMASSGKKNSTPNVIDNRIQSE